MDKSQRSRSRSMGRSGGSRKRSRSAKVIRNDQATKVYSTAYQIDRSKGGKLSKNGSAKSINRKASKAVDKWKFKNEINMWESKI